jgi:hypothetical protein
LKEICIAALKLIPSGIIPEEIPDRRLVSLPSVADVSLLDSLVEGGWEPQYDIFDSLPTLIEFRQQEIEFHSYKNSRAVLNAMRGVTE